MGIIFVTGFLMALAVAGLYWRLPPVMRARGIQARLAMLVWGPPPARHAQQEPPDSRTLLQRWEDGPRAQVVGIDACPRCSQAPILQNGGPHCPRCGWARPAGRPPWAVVDAAEYLNGKLETAHAIAAEPRPGLVALPAATQDISGGGAAAPEPPQAPRGPCPQTDGSMVVPGAWRARLTAALGVLAGPPQADPAPPGAQAGPLPPGGDQLDPADPADPADDQDETWTRWGAMRWRPTALATAADQVRAWCGAQDAAAALICEAIAVDAAAYLAGLRRQLTGGPA